MNDTRGRTFVFVAQFVALLSVAAAPASSAPADAGGAAASVQAVRTPQGGIHPQAETDEAGNIHLIYFKGDPMRGDIYYVRSDDGGQSFTGPVRVNSDPGSVIVAGTMRGPQLALGKSGRPHVAWMGSDRAAQKVHGKKTPMLYSRLADGGEGGGGSGGRAFEPQRDLIRAHPGLDGGGSVAADAEGNVYVAWHAPAAEGVEGEADRTVWVTRSRDDGKTFDAETAALTKKTGACGCCGMKIFAAAGGRVFVVFRSAEKQVNRDIHLLASDDYGKTFSVAAVDPWKVGVCVASTAAVATAPTAGDDAAPLRSFAAWETRENINVATFDAKSPKGIHVFPMPGKDAVRKHPTVAVNSRGEYLVAWSIGVGWEKGGAVGWQRFDTEGRPVAHQSGRAEGLPVWGVPAAVALKDGSFRIFY